MLLSRSTVRKLDLQGIDVAKGIVQAWQPGTEGAMR